MGEKEKSKAWSSALITWAQWDPGLVLVWCQTSLRTRWQHAQATLASRTRCHLLQTMLEPKSNRNAEYNWPTPLLVWSWSHKPGWISAERSRKEWDWLRCTLGRLVESNYRDWLRADRNKESHIIGLVVFVWREISLRTRRCHVGS